MKWENFLRKQAKSDWKEKEKDLEDNDIVPQN